MTAGRMVLGFVFCLSASAQPPVECVYSLLPATDSFTAAGDVGSAIVSTASGCSWKLTSDVPWITFTQAESGTGPGFAPYVVTANPLPIERAGTIMFGGKKIRVRQAGADSTPFTCTTEATPRVVRATGLTELAGDIVLRCSGSAPPSGIVADFDLFVNTHVTSRLVTETTDETEILLLLDDPATPALGQNAFRGRTVGYNSVRWRNVPIARAASGPQTRTIRIVNLRVNVSSIGASTTLQPNQVTAFMLRDTNAVAPLRNRQFIVGLVGAAINPSDLRNLILMPAGGVSNANVAFSERQATDFRLRIGPGQDPGVPGISFSASESGYVNTQLLGAATGLADTGTRLLLRLRDIAPGVRIFAPVELSSGAASAQLISADGNGRGGSRVQGAPTFGGIYAGIPVQDGSATAVWEISSASENVIESLAARIVVENASAQAGTIRFSAAFAPLGGFSFLPSSTGPIPRFIGGSDASIRPPTANLQVNSSARVVGSNVRLSYQVRTSDTANNVIVGSNASLQMRFTSCSATNNGFCTVSGNEVQAMIPNLPRGQTANIEVDATITGSVATANSTVTSTAVEDLNSFDNRDTIEVDAASCTPQLLPASATARPEGGSATINVSGCASVTVTSGADWLTIVSSPTASAIRYGIGTNASQERRTGSIFVNGAAFVVIQESSSCRYTVATPNTSFPDAGGSATTAISTTPATCAWTASSPVPWISFDRESGLGTQTVRLTVGPNPSGVRRTALLDVAGQIIEIVQSERAAAAGEQTPVIHAVLNAFSNQPGRVSAGLLVTITGRNLAPGAVEAPPASTVSLLVGGRAASIIAAAPTQISAHLPADLPAGDTTIIVDRAGQRSPAFPITVAEAAPALSNSFFNAAGASVSTANPAESGAEITVYAIGLSAARPPVVRVGGLEATLVRTRPAPRLTGVHEVVFRIPAGVRGGPNGVTIEVDGIVSLAASLQISGVSARLLNAASFSDASGFAAGSLVSLFAGGLGSIDRTGLFPASEFEGISVTFNGTAAPLFDVVGTRGQINLIVPNDLPESGEADVRLRRRDGSSVTFRILLTSAAPGIFPIADPQDSARPYAAAVVANTASLAIPLSLATRLGIPAGCGQVNPAGICGEPVARGTAIQIYVTGLGKTKLPLATGEIAPASGSPLYETLQTPEVTIGGVRARVDFAGLTPGFAGLYQINTVIPADAVGDDVPLEVRMPNGASHTSRIAVR